MRFKEWLYYVIWECVKIRFYFRFVEFVIFEGIWEVIYFSKMFKKFFFS